MIDFPGHDPRFLLLLANFEKDELHNDGGTIYGVWPDYALAYFNLEWLRFSERNGGEPQISATWRLGRCVLDAVAEPLRPFFAENFERCLREKRPWEHLYECSSADQFRLFHMTTFPLGDMEGLLVVNSLRQEVAHTRLPCPPLDQLYRNEQGFVVQCSHCRRVRRIAETPVWDWVPEWVSTQPPSTSHGLCEPCIGFHHPLQHKNRDGFLESLKTYS